jgi:hypothetical protein
MFAGTVESPEEPIEDSAGATTLTVDAAIERYLREVDLTALFTDCL